MNKKSSIRKQLILSSVSLLTCCAMLAGTTYAWFTDSVSTGTSMIQAGNLDVALYVKDKDGNYQPASSDAAVFDNTALWEPGHTEIAYLKVANEGSLALQYSLICKCES